MRVLLVSPYHGGSHAAWAEGLARHSRHEVGLLTLPARFWKWRMHGAAVTLARRLQDTARPPDLLLVTDMLDLTTFLALTRPMTASTPVVLYAHENQLTYPLPDDPDTGPMRRQRGERDLHYAFINFTSMLAADRVVFNSEFHRRSFLEALPGFLSRFPEHKELATVEELESRSAVLPVGIDGTALEARRPTPTGAEAVDRSPLILWNQRWEYDKNPEAFFAALFDALEAGVDFRVALCGERFGREPQVFSDARQRLGDRVVQAGFAPRDRYGQLLWEATVTVSTADHEYFGVSILEAIFCHTFPLLPRRLSYPELLPDAAHDRCLYRDHDDLVERLVRALERPRQAAAFAAGELAPAAAGFDWERVAPRYDELLSACA